MRRACLALPERVSIQLPTSDLVAASLESCQAVESTPITYSVRRIRAQKSQAEATQAGSASGFRWAVRFASMAALRDFN